MQGNSAVFSIPHSLKDWLLVKEISTGVKLSISGSFFSQKEFLGFYTMLTFYFPLGGCVDEFVDNRTNYQRYKLFIWLTVIHLMNGEKFR